MIYIRGHARDYDQWRQMGLTGWSYSEVLPYFKRSETHHAGGDAYHGDKGPLHVSKGESDSPFYSTLIEAGRQAGHKTTKDFNGYQQEGFGPYDLTIRDGQLERLAVAIGGSGTVRYGGTTRDLSASIAGSGDVRVGAATGSVSRSIVGSGTVIIGR